MPAITPAKISQMATYSDPKQAIYDALGTALDKVQVTGALVLVGTYIPPNKIGSIFLTDKSQDESLWQGCMGMVLKVGPLAFQDDGQHTFHEDDKRKPGDWVMFRYSSAWEQHLNGVSVRFVPDTEIKGRTDDPSIWTSRPIPALGG